MNNRYFDLVNTFRRNKGSLISRYKEYLDILDDLEYMTPNYKDLEDIIRFVVALEYGFLYPNEKGSVYYSDDTVRLTCPIITKINKKSISMKYNSAVIHDMDNGRFDITIELSEGDQITIKIMDNKTNKAHSQVTFTDGEYECDTESFEDILFETIIYDMMYGVRQLIDVYTGMITKQNKNNILLSVYRRFHSMRVGYPKYSSTKEDDGASLE